MRTKEWLIKKRGEYGLTQKMLADESKINKYTIENIEQGRRLGSAKTWEALEEYFESKDFLKGKEPESKLSFESRNIIQDLELTISEFGENANCILIYKIIDEHILFTDFFFNIENPEDQLEEGEKCIETTLKYALEVFESQNKLF